MDLRHSNRQFQARVEGALSSPADCCTGAAAADPDAAAAAAVATTGYCCEKRGACPALL